MPNQYTASVIIPVHNGADCIVRQIIALTGQVGADPFEVLLINNGSSDDSLQVMRTATADLPDFVVVDAQHAHGISEALNAGVALAKAPLVLTTDQDDLVDAGWVAGMVAGLSDERLVAGATALDYEPLNVRAFDTAEFSLSAPVHRGFLPFALNCNMAFERDLHRELGGFDPAMDQAQDIDFCWRAGLAGVRVGFCRDARLLKSLRPSAWSRFRQHRGYGHADVLLARKFATAGYGGTGARAWKQVGWLALSWPRKMLTRRGRSDLMAIAGNVAGVARGVLQSRKQRP